MNEWISVEDRLPEMHQEILVHVKGGGITVAEFCHNVKTNENAYISNVIVDDSKVSLIKNVTHWIPLPEGPK